MIENPNENIDTSEFFEPEETMRISSDFTPSPLSLELKSSSPIECSPCIRRNAMGNGGR